MAGDPGTRPLLRMDMHIHTGRSFDCRTDLDDVVRTARRRGLDRICITDHNEIDGALWLRDRYGPFIIVGEEVKTAERVDIIGLYIHERIPARTPARETCMRIREQGGLVYIPHPFASRKGTGSEILEGIADLVHVVEGFNARIHDPRLNEKAVAWARARGLPVGAGSDAHTRSEIGRATVTLPDFDDTAEGLLAALRSATIRGTASSRLVHLASTFAKVRNKVSGGRRPLPDRSTSRSGDPRIRSAT